jgi:hypothetical protein
MTDEKKPSNSPVRCGCGREELLTPAISQAANAGSEEQRPQDERPGPQLGETAVTAGPVQRNEEKH